MLHKPLPMPGGLQRELVRATQRISVRQRLLVHPLSGRRTVTVFGGTGFLGHQVVDRLLDRDFTARIAARHPERNEINDASGRLEAIRADINDEKSITCAVADAFAVVNAVSLYVEQRPNTFWSVHVEAASRLARCSRAMGVARFVHMSGIGANAASSSSYIRSRAEGEQAVRAAFPEAVIIRPSVMFGPDDAFLAPLANLAQKLPVFPLFGRGGHGAAAILRGRCRRRGCAYFGRALARTNI